MLAFAEDRGGVAAALCAQADLAIGRGRPSDAIAPLRRALATWQKLDFPLGVARTHARLERALAEAGDLAEAAAHRKEWQGILAELGLDEACLRQRTSLTA